VINRERRLLGRLHCRAQRGVDDEEQAEQRVVRRRRAALRALGDLAEALVPLAGQPEHERAIDGAITHLRVATEHPFVEQLRRQQHRVRVVAALDVVLDGDDPVYRWVSGTGLRPFVNALQGLEREAFIAESKKRVAEAYPKRASGKTLFPFKRLFAVARKV